MTDSPEKLADPLNPTPTGPASTDALSEILRTVRLRGDAVTRWSPAPPFHVTVPAAIRVLHIAETAGLTLHIDDRALSMNPGDMVLLARGDAHSISDGHRTGPRGLAGSDRNLGVMQGVPSSPRWLSGTFAVDSTVADPLLSVLPPAIIIRAGAPGHEWLPLSLQLLLAETTEPRPGARVMISRILDLLFIHALREWSRSADTAPGWLTAAMDPQLGPVLTAVHNDPAHPWTVTELADLARHSRSTFAERFTRLFGQPPVAYVTERRLDRAADLLLSTTVSVSKIGQAVGYTSDSAFSRAFQRRYGAPPLRWRNRRAP
ncbi:cupin domain-containing protein [Mycolicibacterium setense]|uniref:cupin domain-containing protein n=1 Tax=Mycolicibacterium setense TaxID=431269 RepID=UPI000574C0D3|nr:cupin domain-containing protein [Mycolicibacterium setense]KHO23156.1 AraC family transcriptional regulator [Mycolicibacterium setense]MCV7115328.1 AraC family transcriptional regulator [Mycolicibacterium setense]